MDPLKFKGRPEAAIAEKIDAMLRARGWVVIVIVGNQFQSGMPDRWISHKNWGGKWVEYKNPEKYHFTPAQWETFPRLLNNGTPIWILTAATEDEYKKLFEPPNVNFYLGRSKKYF